MKNKYKYIILGLVFLFGSTAWSTDPYPKNPDIDIHNYRFEFTLSDEIDLIQGTTTIDFIFKKGGMSTLRLDLVNKSDALEGKGMVVESVTENGTTLKYTHLKNELLITFSPSEKNESRQVRIVYKGIPASGLKIAPNKHGDRTFFSDNWPNKGRNWLPMVDHPYDKATCEFLVTAPSHYQVISNGLKMEETSLENDLRFTHWKQSVPIAPWLYVLGAAEFAIDYVDTFDGKSIQTWVYKQDRDAGFSDFEEPTKKVLQFYTDYVGPYAYEKLANIQSNSVGGGMEAASAVLYGDKSVTGEKSIRWRNVVIHEIAHQWFGNAVTEYDWDDVWLSEGFATYFTLLFIENAYGRDEFVEGLKSARKRVIDFYAKTPDYTIVHDNLKDMGKVSNGMTYQKGAWVLHMLRNKIGDKAFEKGIKSYYANYINSNATTDDFKNEMEFASGIQLDSFFKQWLYSGKNPSLSIDWSYNSQKKEIVFKVAQKTPFDIPVQLAVFSNEGEEYVTFDLEITKSNSEFKFQYDNTPKKVDVDPETVLLGTWTIKEK